MCISFLKPSGGIGSPKKIATTQTPIAIAGPKRWNLRTAHNRRRTKYAASAPQANKLANQLVEMMTPTKPLTPTMKYRMSRSEYCISYRAAYQRSSACPFVRPCGSAATTKGGDKLYVLPGSFFGTGQNCVANFLRLQCIAERWSRRFSVR